MTRDYSKGMQCETMVALYFLSSIHVMCLVCLFLETRRVERSFGIIIIIYNRIPSSSASQLNYSIINNSALSETDFFINALNVPFWEAAKDGKRFLYVIKLKSTN